MTWEPLSNIIADALYSCAVYAKKIDLLDTQRWKQEKSHARTTKRPIRTLKKSKYRQAKTSRRYKHGWQVPRDYAHALQLVQNGNDKWRDAIDLEIEQIKQYQVFKDYGKAVYEKGKVIHTPKEYQKLEYTMCLMCHQESNATTYSGVVSLRSLRLAMFLAELNAIQLWGADIGNAYLQALTKEKLYVVAGPEFEELQGHVLVMHKALYSTRHRGACWHDKPLILISKWISNLQKQTQTYG